MPHPDAQASRQYNLFHAYLPSMGVRRLIEACSWSAADAAAHIRLYKYG